jgi:hypothetical protein
MATNDPPSISAGSEYALGDTSASVAYRSNGARLTGGTTTNSWGSTYTTGDVIGLAFDANTGKVWLGKQTGGTGSMVWQASGDPAAGTNQAATLPTGVPFYFSAGGESGISISLNCGQQPWSATPPTGFVALNTFNLPTSTIVKGGSVMTAYTWSGNSTEPRAFTDVGFKPDFYWSKVRNAGSSQHILIDSVRGVNGQLSSDNTDAEDTTNFAVKFDSFDANGFTLSKGSNATFGYYQGNLTGRNYVGWMWQAGQGTTSSNTAGSITSTVSANTSAGFSVVTYTGTGSAGVRIGHGLGVAPRMMIVKQRGGTTNWAVYHASLPSAFGIAGTQVINLNTTSANTQNFDVWESNNPEATVFSVGASTLSNANGGTYVAYCFAQIAGYSAFGSYTGNGSADGVFVHLGFRPRFLMIKRTDTGGTDWVLLDSSRDPTNVVDQYLAANLSDAEAVYANDKVDFLSNGFKQRGTASGQNGSGGTFIYMAFAENPFKNSLAR